MGLQVGTDQYLLGCHRSGSHRYQDKQDKTTLTRLQSSVMQLRVNRGCASDCHCSLISNNSQ